MRFPVLACVLLGTTAHLHASFVASSSCYLHYINDITHVVDTASEVGPNYCFTGVPSGSGGVTLEVYTVERGHYPDFVDPLSEYSLYSEASVDGPWNFKVSMYSYETSLTAGPLRPGYVSFGVFGTGGTAPGFGEAAISDGTHAYIQLQDSPQIRGVHPFTLGTPFSILIYVNQAASQADFPYFRATGGGEIEARFYEADGQTRVNVFDAPSSILGIPIPIGSVPVVSSFQMFVSAAILLFGATVLRDRFRAPVTPIPKAGSAQQVP